MKPSKVIRWQQQKPLKGGDMFLQGNQLLVDFPAFVEELSDWLVRVSETIWKQQVFIEVGGHPADKSGILVLGPTTLLRND